MAYAFFLLQSVLFGTEVGLVWWKPGPVQVAMAVFVGCLTAYSLAAAIREAP